MKHMRKMILAVLVAALLLTSGVAMAASASSCTVTADRLYLRAAATSDSEALLSLREGTVLQITGKSGQWYKVSYGNYEGYVYSSYVELIEDDTLTKGSKGDAVKQLQQRLKELGYYSSSCDGNYGNVTVTAVKAFQKKNGLDQTGVADSATQKKLNSSSAVSAKGTAVSSKDEEDDADDETLKKGSKGSAVKQLQQRLKQLGYYNNTIDGDYGSSTVSAVKAFQKKNGLTQTGTADEKTLDKVYSTSAVNAKDTVEDADTSTTLKRGSTGTAVKKLQQRLKDLGYYNTVVDGEYGSGTVTAVKAFQKKNGLSQTGTADETTLTKVYSSSAISAKEEADTSTDYTTLKRGSKGTEVTKLQKRLKELGYYNTVVDGEYGSGTVTAVKAFQKKNSLTQTGTADAATQKKIYSSSAISAKDTEDTTTDYTTLTRGSKGSDVKKLQTRLKELGYYKSTIDSEYGSGTASAVKAFQKKNGLTQTGIADATTLKKVYSSSAVSATEKEDTTTYTTLKSGSTGDAVKKLQQRLKELGYYKNAIDSQYGSGMVTAVRSFQKKNGLTQTGIADADTQKKIYASSAISATDKTETEDDTTSTTTTLKRGSKGTEVTKLQQRLKVLGYYTTVVDGEYGSGTVTAVKAFQKKNGLTQTGTADATTLTKVYSSSAIAADDKTDDNDDDATTDGTLKKGSSGSAVKAVQQRLKELGYYSSVCDGDYGSKTVTAVKAFQKKNGLTQSGECDAATLKKLNSDDAVNASGTTASDTLNTSQTLESGDSGNQVKLLQQRLKELGYYTTTIDSSYGYRTAAAVSAFQRANGLTVTGTANSTTLKKLVSSSAVSKSEADAKDESSKTYVTEKLDWFNGGRAKLPKGSIIQVKDVKTGLVFNAKVLYGTNHLDAEPLTAADTAILLKINGGVDFSYKRRPMLVKYNGHVYASSIYSEPHGDQSIYDNNFDGQFCLHFYGTKLHKENEDGEQVVDAEHQACVAQAMKATW